VARSNGPFGMMIVNFRSGVTPGDGRGGGRP
jgi:hypothetical protein